MKVGDRVQVRAYKSDGTCYRWWTASVEALEGDAVVLVSPVGHRVNGPDGAWASQHAIRSFYWRDRWYSLLEAYAADGRLDEIYVNIGSPALIEDSRIQFTDYELDVSLRPPGAARIVDEDEFREAASAYGYSQEFRQACYQVAEDAVGVAARWVARGMPDSAA